ncbi:MAG: glycogen debranching N-terminal domain-containing protein [Alphaproteobacteria bacterium]
MDLEAAADIARPDDEGSAPFYIPASESLAQREPRTLKHGDTFGVFDHNGDIIRNGGPEGLYHRDTRFLSGLQLLINDRRPLLLGSTIEDDNALLTVDLTNPDLYTNGELLLARDTIHISRTRFLWESTCYERLAVRNFNHREHEISLTVLFAADFADLFEVRGRRRSKRGRIRTRIATDAVEIRYAGLDTLSRHTTIRFDRTPDHIDRRHAGFRLTLRPQERVSLFMTITCGEGRRRRTPGRFFVAMRQARREMRAIAADAATVETSNEILNEVLCRSMADLYMLVTNTSEGPYPYAGIPWFSTPFGRDGIITALEMLWVDPGIARGVLKFLAATQAEERDAEADAEPGKILHETRRGEMARLGEVPFGRYYGSVDATPLFVMLAGLYWERTGDQATITELWPNIEAALGWIETYGDRDGDGFVEYHRQTEGGLANQGWKDSHDSVFHADGRLATGPIALCEVQSYVYAAKRYAARMARELGYAALSATLEHQAGSLKERFEAAFWSDEISSYVLALDGDKKPCRVRASNAGHALFTGIAGPERARLVADGLLGRDFFSGWGIRTIAAYEPRYNPMSYHNGSVWPHDNALIALGLARYGFSDHVERVFSGVFEAATYMDLRRLPELFCGFRRLHAKGPTAYPVACSPQAWAGAAPFALLQACLGQGFDHRSEEVRFRHPRLPPFIDSLVLRSLRIGDTCMDVMLRRHNSDVTVNVLEKHGGGRVAITL